MSADLPLQVSELGLHGLDLGPEGGLARTPLGELALDGAETGLDLVVGLVGHDDHVGLCGSGGLDSRCGLTGEVLDDGTRLAGQVLDVGRGGHGDGELAHGGVCSLQEVEG